MCPTGEDEGMLTRVLKYVVQNYLKGLMLRHIPDILQAHLELNAT